MIQANALRDQFGPFPILVEDKEPTRVLVRRRLKMLGLVETAGQVAFAVLQKLIHAFSKARKQEIISAENLKLDPPADCEIIKIGNVNSGMCRKTLKHLEPRLVVVVGTRMISEKTLQSVKSDFINYHAGLNPMYRGMNGGYWALASNDADNFGITVHLVDKGVDTGAILQYARLQATSRDNITTYPFIQGAAARALLIKVVQSVLSGSYETKHVMGKSQQWFHPAIWRYLWTGFRRGVW